MSFELSASLRRLKPGKGSGPITRRRDAELAFVEPDATAGQPLLLDTRVYIDALRDRLPDAVTGLLRVRQLNHSSVAVAELAYAFGRLDPAHPNTAAALKAIRRTIDRIPGRRLRAPSVTALVEAGILVGIIARARDLPRSERPSTFNDAILYLQALEQGCCLLSRNIGDLDDLQQCLPTGRLFLYRRTR